MSLLLLWLLVAAIGHAATLAFYVNRVHAHAFPRKLIKLTSWPAVFAIPLGWLAWISPLISVIRDGADGTVLDQQHPWVWSYTIVMAPLGVIAIGVWLWRKVIGDPWHHSAPVIAERVDVPAVLQQPVCLGTKAKLMSRVPGNQFCQVSFEQQSLALPRMPRALAGLKLAHLSDFHFTGQLAEAYYDYVIER